MNCPPITDFELMLRGQLDEDRSAVLESHLETCLLCQQVLDGMAVNASLTDALRSGPVPLKGVVSASGMDAMISRLEDMARQFTPSGFDLSAASQSIAGTEAISFEAMQQAENPSHMGTYRIIRLLGAGGMGLVYLAEDEVLHRKVAVKMLRPRLARLTKAREGFLREARAMAALKHDNVVTVFQVGEADGSGAGVIPFLAMELLEGESLADWLRREGPITPSWAARLGMQATDGLATAHARGIVHRDIKPGNLWLESPTEWTELPVQQRHPLPSVARVKVLDFGLAQPSGEDAIEEDRHVFGTPSYMSPEQAAGKEVDPRADLFSMGVVLYEIVSGKLPFPRTSRQVASTYATPLPIRELVPSIPPRFADLIHRLLAFDPNARPASAREVSRELAAWAGMPMDDTGPVASHTTERVPVSTKRSSLLIVVVIAAFFFAVAGWFLIDRSTLTPRPPDWLTQSGPPDDAWIQKVATLPVEQQPTAVLAKLRELNPDYDGQATRLGFEDGKVTEFHLVTDQIQDLRPIQALKGLKSLTVVGSAIGKGRLIELAPIRGLPLTILNVWQNPKLSNITAARGMKLVLFQAGDTVIEDLSPLEGMPIGTLAINNCKVRDLGPIHTLPKIRFLRCDGCPLDSLKPLVGSVVKELTFDFDAKRGDAAIMDLLTGLERINRLPAKEFRRLHPATN